MTKAIAPSRPRGRPTKLDDVRMRSRLIQLIGTGLPQKHACAAVGVSVPAFCEYREKHEWFRDELETAIANGLEARLQVIEAAAKKDWRAAAWYAEHVFPEHFSKQRIELTGANGGPLAAGIGIYLPKKDGDKSPLIEIEPAKEIENESD
jgi:hypothetical protein